MLIAAVVSISVLNSCAHANADFGVLSVNLPPMNLLLVPLEGSQLILDSEDIGSLLSYRAFGGYRNQLGNIRGLGNYTGVSLVTLCNLIGGISAENSIRITASDNYSMFFTYDQAVNGNYSTYDQSGTPTIQHQPLHTIAAYHMNDQNITTDNGGPLRIAIVGPEGLVTDSKYWVKYIAKLEIMWAHDLAVTSVTPSRSFAAYSFPCRINATIANNGAYSEIFDSTLYRNQTDIAILLNIAVANRTVSTLTFTWNTIGCSEYQKYVMKVQVWPVEGEIKTADNNFTDGSVFVVHAGDVNGDAKVDIQDVARVSGSFGSYPYHSKWNPNYDVNGDNKVDIQDLAITSANFGWHRP